MRLFQCLIGFIVLLDLCLRFIDPAQREVATGLIPQSVIRMLSQDWNWSFHLAYESTPYQITFALITALCAVGLIMGRRTKWAFFGAWLMTLSLHNATWPSLNGGDTLMRMLLFWGMFLPDSEPFSIHRSDPSQSSFTTGNGCLLFQMMLLYGCSAILKLNPDWLSGQALAGSLQNDLYATAWGQHLLNYPSLLKILTWGTLGLELSGPLIFLIWPQKPYLRMVTVLALMAMHVTIMATMEVGLFSLVAVAGLSLFIPKTFWDKLPSFMRGLLRLLSRNEGSTEAPSKRSTFVWDVSSKIAFLWILAVNVHGFPGKPLALLDSPALEWARTGLGLWQRWGMFETIPSINGWFVAQLSLSDGSKIDLMQGEASVSWERPKTPSGMFPNHRWRKVFRELAHEDGLGYEHLRDPVCRYLLVRWQENHPNEAKALALELFFCSRIRSVMDGSELIQRRRIHYLHP